MGRLGGKDGNIHPRRIFKRPEELLEAWDLYKAFLLEERHKWLRVQYVGKEGERVTDAQKVPYTYDGFCVFCIAIYGDVNNYFANTLDYYDDFKEVCAAIKQEIRSDQITGGMLGFYKEGITARLNNLKEATDVTSNGDKVQSIDLAAMIATFMKEE